MSFGFSVGDIILCSQIAYRLFSSVTDGRKKASRDLKELEDTLFGLYCALNHLKRDHELILAKASTKPGDNTGQVHVQLGYMIKSCLETLEELDNATREYREAATKFARPEIGNQFGIMGQSSSKPAKKPLKVQWKRVLWDLRGESLSKYRTKLQSHTDAINLLLSTSIWSATDRIEQDNIRQSQRLDEILQEASQFNNNVFQLVQALYASITISQPPPAFGSHGLMHSVRPQTYGPIAPPDSGQGPAIESESGGIIPGSKEIPDPTPQGLIALPLRPGAGYQKAKPPVLEHTIWQSGQYFKLPESIQAINESRRIVGKTEFEERQRQLASVQMDHRLPVPHASPPSRGAPAVDKMSRQLENIFKTLNVPEIDRMTTNDDLQTDIVAWMSKLEHLLEDLHVSPPNFDKQERNIIIGELSQLLVTLNRLIEDSQVGNRGVFYNACGSRIDHVFMQLRSLSTFCEKEIEEFEDERDDWKDDE